MMISNRPATETPIDAAHFHRQTTHDPRRCSPQIAPPAPTRRRINRKTIGLAIAFALAPALAGCHLGGYRNDPSAESASRSAAAAQQRLVAKLQKEIDQAQATLDELRKLRDAQAQRNADLERSYPHVAKKMQRVLTQFNELQGQAQTKPTDSAASRGTDSAAPSTP